MELIKSPWLATYERFARSVRESAILASPFVSSDPLQRFASLVNGAKHPKILFLTNLAVDSLVRGTVDVRALSTLCKELPDVTVRHLPGLHAKAYVADESMAILTSGNLTQGSLNRNYEYGALLTERTLVRKISRDLHEYGVLGSQVSLTELEELAEVAETLQAKHAETLKTTRIRIRNEFQVLFEATHEIHPLVEGIHPDLCDHSVDRVINGVHFGKRWKHMVRNAQQSLKAQGLIEIDNRNWRLAEVR